MYHLTTFGFTTEVRRLSVYCKTAAYRVCFKCVAFDRNRRKLAEVLERDDWVVAYRWQRLFKNSIFEYFESVWTELTAIHGILLVGQQAKAMILYPDHRAPSSCRRAVFTRTQHYYP
eukprot:361561-Pyramimonas_sp.AAC.1